VEDPDLNPLVRRADRGADSVMGMPVSLTISLMREVLEAAQEKGWGQGGTPRAY
jgi:hypothetical protein